MKKSALGVITFSFLIFSSCSLKYVETPNVEEIIPEFVFENTNMTSYDDSVKKTQVSAGVLEQYKQSSENYAKDLSFTAYSNSGEVTSEGKCGYLFADTSKETYQLFDDITLVNNSENIKFHADALQWNGKTEQLTSGKSDTVKIEKDKTVIVGSGFSANGLSRDFKFTGAVSGEVQD